MTAAAVPAVGALAAPDALALAPEASSRPASGASFAHWLSDGVNKVNQQLIDADSKAAAFALDDSIPPHQVTFALEQAKLSLELMLQIRARLVESYQELARMQL